MRRIPVRSAGPGNRHTDWSNKSPGKALLIADREEVLRCAGIFPEETGPLYHDAVLPVIASLISGLDPH